MRHPRQGVRVPVLLGVGLTAVSLLALGAAAKSPTPHRAAPLASNGGGRYTSNLLVGTTVGRDRVLRGVDGVFPSTTRRLTAGLVVAGAPAGKTATITWSREGLRGEQTLFQQQVKVRPRGVLYASARSAHVPLGVYRVHFSLAADRHDAVFVVATPAVAARATGVEKSASAARTLEAALGSADDDLEPSGAAEDPLPDPCAKLPTPEDVKDCNDWYGPANAPSPGGGEPPPNSPPCDSTSPVSLFGSQEIWQFGGYVDFYSNVLFCEEQRTETLAAGVGGAAPGTVKSESGELHWAGDACDVPGRSDLFANVVHGQLTVEGSTATASGVITLDEFGPIPTPMSVSPAVGSLVKPGQRIQLTIAALVQGATRGIKTLEIRDPNGAVLARGGRKSPAGPCEKPLSRFVALASASYKVPRRPPPVIELTLFTETFDGSHVEAPFRYRTRPAVWSGVLKARLDQKVQPGLQIQEYTADVVVWETEVGKLEGEVRGRYKQTLELAKCPSETTVPGHADAALTGTVDSQGMHLTLGNPASTPPTVTPCKDGGQPALMPSPLLIDDLPGLLSKVAPSGNGRYYAAETYTDPAGLYTVRSNVQLDAGADISSDSPLLDMGLADPRAGNR